MELRKKDIEPYLVNTIINYLKNRSLILCKDRFRKAGAKVPQGSILGPTLWNVMYDGVLRMELAGRAETVAYADDLALLVQADNDESLIETTTVNLKRLKDKIDQLGLKLAEIKTEASILKGPRKREHIASRVGDSKLVPTKTAKFLGVTFDSRGFFGPHVAKVVEKAKNRVAALTRVMPNLMGLGMMKRRILA